MILLYHGIVNGYHPAERWCAGQALPLSSFEQHLNWLSHSCRIVSLSDYLEIWQRENRDVTGVVALTFDDGLESTFRCVYPLLKARAVPATFFISTSHIEHGRLLWFSYVNALCLEGAYGELKARGRHFPLLSLELRKRARRELMALAHASRDPQGFSEELAEAYPLPSRVTAEYEGVTYEQLSRLGDCELLEAAAHTLTHPFLDQLPRDEQAVEIFQSKQLLADLVGKPVRYFAYPNGDYNADTVGLVKEAGFDAAFATDSKHLGHEERFEIGRVGIYSTSRLKFWLKTRMVPLARRMGLAVG